MNECGSNVSGVASVEDEQHGDKRDDRRKAHVNPQESELVVHVSVPVVVNVGAKADSGPLSCTDPARDGRCKDSKL